MNRRGFLRTLLAAPLAAPVIAAQAGYARGRWVRGAAGVVGEIPSEQVATLGIDTSAARKAIDELATHSRRIQHMTDLLPRDYTWRSDECRCPQCKPDWSFHPMQAITDAPSIVPEAGGCAPPIRVTSRRTIIAFTGLAGSGKSTAAAHLVVAHRFTRLRFAGPIKDMMAALGLSKREIDGDLKEQPCDLLGGRTPRYAMQTIGTEWGRDLIAPDLWIRAFHAAVNKLPHGKPVVVDDCRFPNEADAIRSLGGALVRLMRAGAGTTSQHQSEGQELGEAIRISNNGTLADLAMDLDHLLTSQVRVGEVRPA